MLVNSTVSDVARKFNLSNDIVTGILNRWVRTQLNWDEFERIEILGIDKISLKRGHKDFIPLITVPLESTGVDVLAVLPNRKKQTVVNFLESIPTRLRATAKRICCDMYEGYVNAAQEQFP